MPTDAQKRANEKYLETLESVRFRVKAGQKAKIQKHAQKQGESINAFLTRAVEETIKSDNKKK